MSDFSKIKFRNAFNDALYSSYYPLLGSSEHPHHDIGFNIFQSKRINGEIHAKCQEVILVADNFEDFNSIKKLPLYGNWVDAIFVIEEHDE